MTESLRFADRESSTLRPKSIEYAPEATARTDDEITDTLYRHLRAGRADKASGLIQLLSLAGRSVAQIVDGSFRLALTRLGEDWTGHDTIGSSWEHRATQICIRTLHELRVGAQPSGLSLAAVGGAPSSDPYILPAMGAATVLDSLGYDVTNLGPQTTSETLVRTIHEQQPALVWLSITARIEPDEIRREVELALEAADAVGAWLIIGGQQAHCFQLPDHPRLEFGHSMFELATFAVDLANRRAG